MSIRDRFNQLAALNGGDLFSFSQKSGLKAIGAAQSKGVCQAFCFFDGLLALTGFDPERTKRKDVVEYSVHFQHDFESLTGTSLKHWSVTDIRSKYIECLGYLELQHAIKVGYVETISNTDQLVGFLYSKTGYFNLLLPNHVTGFYSQSGNQRYFDPNCGTVSFSNQQKAFNFISDYHGCNEFQSGYKIATGDLIVVQLIAC